MCSIWYVYTNYVCIRVFIFITELWQNTICLHKKRMRKKIITLWHFETPILRRCLLGRILTKKWKTLGRKKKIFRCFFMSTELGLSVWEKYEDLRHWSKVTWWILWPKSENGSHTLPGSHTRWLNDCRIHSGICLI